MSGHLVAILRGMGAEVWSVFVDDGLFAGAILSWALLAGVVLPQCSPPRWLPGPLLFAGLAVILVAGAWRACRKRGF